MYKTISVTKKLQQTDRATRCQPCQNPVETSCTSNPQQTEVMELEGYS